MTHLSSPIYILFIGEDDFSVDYIDEGKALMKRSRGVCVCVCVCNGLISCMK